MLFLLNQKVRSFQMSGGVVSNNFSSLTFNRSFIESLIPSEEFSVYEEKKEVKREEKKERKINAREEDGDELSLSEDGFGGIWRICPLSKRCKDAQVLRSSENGAVFLFSIGGKGRLSADIF